MGQCDTTRAIEALREEAHKQDWEPTLATLALWDRVLRALLDPTQLVYVGPIADLTSRGRTDD